MYSMHRHFNMIAMWGIIYALALIFNHVCKCTKSSCMCKRLWIRTLIIDLHLTILKQQLILYFYHISISFHVSLLWDLLPRHAWNHSFKMYVIHVFIKKYYIYYFMAVRLTFCLFGGLFLLLQGFLDILLIGSIMVDIPVQFVHLYYKLVRPHYIRSTSTKSVDSNGIIWQNNAHVWIGGCATSVLTSGINGNKDWAYLISIWLSLCSPQEKSAGIGVWQ